jgi:zinc transport system substrate-binding protein
MRKVYLILVVVIVLVLVIFFVNQSKIKTGSDKLQVTASFYPLYFFASQIGGDKVQVNNITPAGSEPHDYDPSTQDIARIENGNMLILNGGVEAWGDKIKDNLKDKDVKIIVVGDGLLTKELREEGENMKDPHVWLNPQLARQEAAKITEGFIAIDPVNGDYYKGNEKKLDAKLNKLDSDYKAGLANCQSKDIITSHVAFAYLAEQYGLNQVAISGISPDEEPSAQQLAGVADFAKKNNVKYIFFESLVSPKLSETIADEVGAKSLVLDPIEGLSDDDIKQGKNYFTVMEANLKNLQTALSCSK